MKSMKETRIEQATFMADSICNSIYDRGVYDGCAYNRLHRRLLRLKKLYPNDSELSWLFEVLNAMETD